MLTVVGLLVCVLGLGGIFYGWAMGGPTGVLWAVIGLAVCGAGLGIVIKSGDGSKR